MEQKVCILDAAAYSKGGNVWRIESGDIALEYTYDPKLGLAVSRFDHHAGTEDINHVHECVSCIPVKGKGSFALLGAEAAEEVYGGKKVVGLTVSVQADNVTATLRVIAFPGTSVMRQWFQIKNPSIARVENYEYTPFAMELAAACEKDVYYADHMTGGKPVHEAGELKRKPLSRTYYERYDLDISSNMTAEYMPLMMIVHDAEPFDGVLFALEYTGPWSAHVHRTDAYAPSDKICTCFAIDGGAKKYTEPRQSFQTPVVTIAGFDHDRDNLMVKLFDWQYTYMWDYTNPDLYAKTRGITKWIFCGRNLHEQFNYRTAVMTMDTWQLKSGGFDMVWDDAGWSACSHYPADAYSSVFQNNYEGPDYRESQKYMKKGGMNWALWFAGKPTAGVLAAKEGAWGNFEWRTDDIVFRNEAQETGFKKMLKDYLDEDPRRSFHTCSLGGRFAHTFDIQKYATYNYLSDAGGGYNLNYFFSYFEVPDKCGDILAIFGDKSVARDGTMIYTTVPKKESDISYSAEFSRRRLGTVSLPCSIYSDEMLEHCREDNLIYKFMLENGVAGRWSYAYHPEVYGDDTRYYLQRVSKDHLHSVIIFGRKPDRTVRIFPKGLKPEKVYTVSFQNAPDRYSKTGAQLAAEGIAVAPSYGELVYLGLPGAPGAGVDAQPEAPQTVLYRAETNIGYRGNGIYWTSAACNTVHSYEIFRDGEIIATVVEGNYWFDYKPGYDKAEAYTVRAVSLNGSASKFALARHIADEVFSAQALGNHGKAMGLEGWYAESSQNLKTFVPMEFVEPVNTPLADIGGTPNQEGGMEGYWQAGQARVGRGWQKAASDAYCVRKWVSTVDGQVRITGRATSEWYHRPACGDTAVCILKNNETLLPFTPIAQENFYGVAHDLVVDVAKGDQLRFVVGKCAPAEQDPDGKTDVLVGWMPVIQVCDAHKLAGTALRVCCGSAQDVLDEAGNLWQADRWQKVQDGNLSYALPVEIGIYDLRLSFQKEAGVFPGERLFDVIVNGKRVYRDFDIAERRGNTEVVLTGIAPQADGRIHLELVGKKGEARITGIEVAPAVKDSVRISCGSQRDYIDWAGRIWQADPQLQSGEAITGDISQLIQASPTIYDRELYAAARQSRAMRYELPLSDGFYSVHLKFAELWQAEKGARPMDILVNGVVKKANWDAYAAAGYEKMAMDLRFENISPVNGKITVEVAARSQVPAILQAIECD